MSEKTGALRTVPVTVPVLEKSPRANGQAAESRAGNERAFLELRRKVQDSELLSASAERLLQEMRFNGRLNIVIQNGRVVKSAYEEGYFRRKNDLQGLGLE